MYTKKVFDKIQEETLQLLPTRKAFIVEIGYYNGHRGDIVGIEYGNFHPFKNVHSRCDDVFLHVKMEHLEKPGRFQYVSGALFDMPRLKAVLTDTFWAKVNEPKGWDHLKCFSRQVRNGGPEIVGPFGAIVYHDSKVNSYPLWWAVTPMPFGNNPHAFVSAIIAREDFAVVDEAGLSRLPLSPSSLIRQIASQYLDPDEEIESKCDTITASQS